MSLLFCEIYSVVNSLSKVNREWESRLDIVFILFAWLRCCFDLCLVKDVISR